jgi:2,4-dienoyl-CoA reductase-like NADH-dependent reductase (Old Yellow Enzyme family)
LLVSRRRATRTKRRSRLKDRPQAAIADLIALARTILYNPRWPWHAAAHFGAHVKAPNQYLRSEPRQYPDLFDIGH